MGKLDLAQLKEDNEERGVKEKKGVRVYIENEVFVVGDERHPSTEVQNPSEHQHGSQNACKPHQQHQRKRHRWDRHCSKPNPALKRIVCSKSNRLEEDSMRRVTLRGIRRSDKGNTTRNKKKEGRCIWALKSPHFR
jgi:hypothetical protein